MTALNDSAPVGTATYRIEDIARLLACSTRTAWRLADSGKIPGKIKLTGRLVRFSKKAVDCWLNGGGK